MKVSSFILILVLSVQLTYGFELTSEIIQQWISEQAAIIANNIALNGTNSTNITIIYPQSIINGSDLNIGYKGISSINVNAFQNLKDKIVTLRLNGNKLTSLPAGVFDGLTNLVTLDLSYNQLTDGSYFFPVLPSLQFLNLDMNLLTTFTYKVSSYFPNLQTLSLASNSINNLPATVFQNAVNLIKLTVSYNKLGIFDPTPFQRMPKLEYLTLAKNGFTTIDKDFLFLPNLKTLDLGYNSISTIIPTAFNRLPSLSTMHLYWNSLTSLHPDLFQYNQLEALYVYQNLLTTIDPNLFYGIYTLKSVSAARNKITSLSENLFETNPQLVSFDVQTNNLASIPVNIFQPTKMIQTIYLNGNQFTSFDPKVVSGLTKLCYLNLMTNKFTIPVDSVEIKNQARSSCLSVYV